MNANELRIGNLVNGTLGIDNVLTVESILSSTLIAFLHSDDKEILYEYQLENLKPIELSPEWLTRFGFVNNGIMWSNQNDMVIDYDLTWIGIHMKRQLDDIEFDLPKHVHGLQNLIFALTGTELTLKP